METMIAKLAVTFFIAMAPVVELRGAIPMGVAAGLSPAAAAVTAVLGNFVPAPVIMLLIRRVFALLRRNAWCRERIRRLTARAHLKGRMVRRCRVLGLVLLVGVPLPGTGAWTGALVADILDIRMRVALPTIFAGLVISAAITTAITCGVAWLV